MQVWKLEHTATKDLKTFLEKNEFEFYSRPHQIFFAKKNKLSVSMYQSGKLVFNDPNCDDYFALLDFLVETKSAEPTSKSEPKQIRENRLAEITETHIGTDESGKGDYFGPLIISGVMLSIFEAEDLADRGIMDSKKLNDKRIKELAKEIREAIPLAQRTVVCISPGKYNLLYDKMKNINTLLGWGHATAIENLLSQDDTCKLAVADKFGSTHHIENALKKYGRGIKLIQEVRAESNTAVAAASVLARERFLFEIEAMSQKYKLKFPKGATHVIPTAVQFTRVWGGEELKSIAKYHFSTTNKVMSRING